MERQKFFVVSVLAAMVGLAGCAARPSPPITIAQARASLIGLHPDEVRACLGSPPLQRDRGSITLWSYPSPVATTSMGPVFTDPASATFTYTPFSADPGESGTAFGPALGVSEGPVPPSGCIVNVVFDSGTARAVTFAGPGGGLLKQDPECSQVVRPCVK